jgi:cytochrome P450
MAETVEGIDLQALAREIAMRMAPDALLDFDDIGAWLKLKPRYVSEELSKHPDFPRAVQFDTTRGRKTHARYLRADIAAFIERRRAGKNPAGGRPRRDHRAD